jgi:hypothetical protein
MPGPGADGCPVGIGGRENVMLAAVILLGLGALGGAVLATLRLKGGNPPIALAAVHGLAAAAGLVALTVVVVSDGHTGAPAIALGLLVAAALVGFFLLANHVKGRLIPLPFMFLHGGLAVFGYAVLLSHYLS